jgi:hypothetical protein
MVCFRHIIVNTLHKVDDKDDDNDNNNNNNNNNKETTCIMIDVITEGRNVAHKGAEKKRQYKITLTLRLPNLFLNFSTLCM